MFGRQDELTNTNSNEGVNAIDAAVAALPNSVSQGMGQSSQNSPSMITNEPQLTSSSPVPVTDQPWQATTNQPQGVQNSDVLSPAGGYPQPPSQRLHTLIPTPLSDDNNNDSNNSTPPPTNDDTSTTDDNSNVVVDNELSSIKVQALDELYPLFDKLDLTPEERFRTLMMMIQASDNQKLIKSAYESAHSIPDEKDRAQALLDIINEINYFTQQPPVTE